MTSQYQNRLAHIIYETERKAKKELSDTEDDQYGCVRNHSYAFVRDL
jgi:hypothetical protein